MWDENGRSVPSCAQTEDAFKDIFNYTSKLPQSGDITNLQQLKIG